MKLKKLSVSVRYSEKGFTLLEILIGLMIIGFLSGSVLMIMTSIVNNNNRNLAHMAAVKQVENAVHWISHDVQMAQIITPGGTGGFPFTVSWTDWDNTQYQVIYSLDASGLQRQYTETGANGEVETNTFTVARDIVLDTDKTFCDYNNNVFDMTLTAEVNNIAGSVETRVVSIRPRSV